MQDLDSRDNPLFSANAATRAVAIAALSNIPWIYVPHTFLFLPVINAASDKSSLSGSYTLKNGDAAYDDFIEALSNLFEQYAENNTLTIAYKTVAYIGEIALKGL